MDPVRRALVMPSRIQSCLAPGTTQIVRNAYKNASEQERRHGRPRHGAGYLFNRLQQHEEELDVRQAQYPCSYLIAEAWTRTARTGFDRPN